MHHLGPWLLYRFLDLLANVLYGAVRLVVRQRPCCGRNLGHLARVCGSLGVRGTSNRESSWLAHVSVCLGVHLCCAVCKWIEAVGTVCRVPDRVPNGTWTGLLKLAG